MGSLIFLHVCNSVPLDFNVSLIRIGYDLLSNIRQELLACFQHYIPPAPNVRAKKKRFFSTSHEFPSVSAARD